MKSYLAPILAIALCAGCVSTPNGQRVSPIVLQITTATVCAGSAYVAIERPQDVPRLIAARNLLTAACGATNADMAGLVAALQALRTADNNAWLTPAVVLLSSWASQQESAREVALAIRDGLNCAGTKSAALTGFRETIVRVYRGRNGEWFWQPVASNGRILPGGSAGFKDFADCRGNATRNNPGRRVIAYR